MFWFAPTTKRAHKSHRWMVLVVLGVLLAQWSTAAAAATKLVFGSDHEFPPYEFLDDDGKPAGFTVDLIRAIGREIGVEIEVRLGPWPDIRRAMEVDGTIDIADMYFAEPRMHLFDFTKPFDIAYDQLFVRIDDPNPCALEELDGRRVMAQRGASSEDFLRGLSNRIEVIPVSSEPEALRRLAKGTADCVLASQVTGQHTIRKLGFRDVTGTGPPINPRTYSFVVRKGRRDLVTLLDQGLVKVKQSGEFSRIYQRWLGSQKTDQPTWMKYTIIAVGALAVFGLLALTLLYSLRRTIRSRTADLKAELIHRTRAEEALRSSEDRLRVLVERAPEAIVVFDLEDFSAVEANQNALNLLNAASADDINLVAASNIDPVENGAEEPDPKHAAERSAKDIWKRYAEAAAESEEAVFEWQFAGPDGVPRPTEVRLVPFPDEHRRLIRASIVDISERRALLAQLLHSQRLDSVGRLAGGVAHDFNNLLTVLIGQADYLRRKLDPNSPLVSAAIDIETACNRAATLTKQLLAFSRRQVMRMEPVVANKVIDNLEGMLRRSLGEDISLAVDLHDGDTTIVADSAQLEQALLNLAVNARDAMPDGGTLTLSTRVRPSSDGQNRSVVEMEVRDSGEGIPPAVKARIFEPFFTTKEAGRGTGLGLAMVHGIVLQSGGAIDVDSKVGDGTTFTIAFPLYEGANPEPSVALPVLRDMPTGSERVLVVEDEARVRELMVATLRECGYQVDESGRPSEALALARASTYDILVTDVVMPEMSGRELADKIRHRVSCVLYVTGYSRDQALRHRGLSDTERVLDKPFRAEDLAVAVRAILDSRSVASSTISN